MVNCKDPAGADMYKQLDLVVKNLISKIRCVCATPWTFLYRKQIWQALRKIRWKDTADDLNVRSNEWTWKVPSVEEAVAAHGIKTRYESGPCLVLVKLKPSQL